jgi:hypothetical protein
MSVETRPGAGGRSSVSYPEAWIKRHGPPPTDKRALRAWLKVNHLDDLVDYVEGRSVPWLDVDAAEKELERR